MPKRINALFLLLFLPSAIVICLAQQNRNLTTGQQALAGTEWRLISLGRVGAESIVKSNTRVTLKFTNDARVNGSGGCNTFGGNYSVQGDRIRFSQVFSTRRACVDTEANRQESEYFAALESANRFRLVGRGLTIYYEAGRSALNLANDKAAVNDQPTEDQPEDALRSYYQAINSKNFERAYQYWETPQQGLDQFINGFADTSTVKLLIDPVPEIQGAAGSSYANISTLLVSQRANGVERLFAGCYVMRKSNLRPEDGQTRQGWRIYKATVSPLPPNARASTLATLFCRE